MTTPDQTPSPCRFVMYAPAEPPGTFPVPAVVIRTSADNGHPGLEWDRVMLGVDDYVRELPEGNLTLGVFGLDGFHVVNDVPPGDWSWPA